MASIVDAEPCSDGVTYGAADSEGDHELLARHVERAGSENERAEWHGRRKNSWESNGEDGVVSHPVADAFEDAGGDVFFKEGHASALAYLMAEVSAKCRAGRGEENEQDDVLLAG